MTRQMSPATTPRKASVIGQHTAGRTSRPSRSAATTSGRSPRPMAMTARTCTAVTSGMVSTIGSMATSADA
jgi:hypothetical protein